MQLTLATIVVVRSENVNQKQHVNRVEVSATFAERMATMCVQEKVGTRGGRNATGPESLSLGALAFGVALTYFETRIALANHVDATTPTYDLAIRMTVFKSPN